MVAEKAKVYLMSILKNNGLKDRKLARKRIDEMIESAKKLM